MFSATFLDAASATLARYEAFGARLSRIEVHYDTVQQEFHGCWGVTPSGQMFVPDGSGVSYVSLGGLLVYIKFERRRKKDYETHFKLNIDDWRPQDVPHGKKPQKPSK